jgi:hypothetical protein
VARCGRVRGQHPVIHRNSKFIADAQCHPQSGLNSYTQSVLAFVFVLVYSRGQFVCWAWWFQVGQRALPRGALAQHVVLSAMAVLEAWLLVHTVFTLHYAHIYMTPMSGTAATPAALNFRQTTRSPTTSTSGSTAFTTAGRPNGRRHHPWLAAAALALLHHIIPGFNTSWV